MCLRIRYLEICNRLENALDAIPIRSELVLAASHLLNACV